MVNRRLKLFLKGEWGTIVGEDKQKDSIREENVCEEPDISEPVWTIIDLFKKNPKDFKIKKYTKHSVNGLWVNTYYKAVHVPTNIAGKMNRDFGTIKLYEEKNTEETPTKIPLTLREHKLLFSTFRDYFEKRAQRYSEVRMLRQKTKDTKERLRITASLQGEQL